MSNTEFFAERGLTVAPGTRFRVPVGNTGNRPSNASNGDFRFNTDIGNFEGYISGAWGAVGGAANVQANGQFTNTLSVGNSTANVFVNSSAVVMSNVVINSSGFFLNGVNGVGNNLVIGVTTVNTTGVGIGNSTVSTVANSTAIVISSTLGTTVLQPTQIVLGNSSVNSSINSTAFSGKALTANNASFLGGTAAASYVTTSTIGGIVSGLTANNTGYLGGVAANHFWTDSNLTAVSQLTNNMGYIVNNQAVTFSTCQATSYHYSYGPVYAQGDVYAGYSDIRLKCKFVPVENAIDMVERLSAYYYYPTEFGSEVAGFDPDKRRIGLIAQEVQEVLPEAVSLAAFDRDPETNESISGENYLTVSEDKCVPLLFAAVKEMSGLIRELQAEIRLLKGN